MALVGRAVLLLLVISAVLFALYAATGQARYKSWGLKTLMCTLIAAFGFFAVLIVERI